MKLNGNRGVAFPDPGKVEKMQCGVCESPMEVTRNLNGPTSFAAALGKLKRRHDRFLCPHYQEQWHEQVARLMSRALHTDSPRERRMLEEDIADILKAHSRT